MIENTALTVACWNINSVRARIPVLNNFLSKVTPDILLLQEIKCATDQFPSAIAEDYSYNTAIMGQKSYNGVAILSKFPIEQIRTSFTNNPCSEQSRFIQCSCLTDIGYITFISVYVPNGTEVGHDRFELKLQFIEALGAYLHEQLSLGEYIIVGGDFNVALAPIDVHSANLYQDKLGFTTKERQTLATLLDIGLVDCYRSLNPETQEFSWWDYRAGAFRNNLGMRIDLILASHNIAKLIRSSCIERETRAAAKTSDHAPVITHFKKYDCT